MNAWSSAISVTVDTTAQPPTYQIHCALCSKSIVIGDRYFSGREILRHVNTDLHRRGGAVTMAQRLDKWLVPRPPALAPASATIVAPVAAALPVKSVVCKGFGQHAGLLTGSDSQQGRIFRVDLVRNTAYATKCMGLQITTDPEGVCFRCRDAMYSEAVRSRLYRQDNKEAIAARRQVVRDLKRKADDDNDGEVKRDVKDPAGTEGASKHTPIRNLANLLQPEATKHKAAMKLQKIENRALARKLERFEDALKGHCLSKWVQKNVVAYRKNPLEIPKALLEACDALEKNAKALSAQGHRYPFHTVSECLCVVLMRVS